MCCAINLWCWWYHKSLPATKEYNSSSPPVVQSRAGNVACIKFRMYVVHGCCIYFHLHIPVALLVPLVACLLLNSLAVRAVIQEMQDLISLWLFFHRLFVVKCVISPGIGPAAVMKNCVPKRAPLWFFVWWKAVLFLNSKYNLWVTDTFNEIYIFFRNVKHN